MKVFFITGLVLLVLVGTATADSTTAGKNKPWWGNKVDPYWSPLPDVPVDCSMTCGALSNIGRFYQICGRDAFDSEYGYLLSYVGAGWSISAAQHPNGYGVSGHSAARAGAKLVISGGYCCEDPSGFYDYTTVFYTGSGNWEISTPMPQPKMAGTSMAFVNGKCYLFGGTSNGVTLNTTYEWVPGDAVMVKKANMPAARDFMACTTLDAPGGDVYLLGGRGSDHVTAYDTIWRYEPATDTWTVMSEKLNRARYKAGAVGAEDFGAWLYIIGGNSGTASMDSVEIYDVTGGTVTETTPLPYSTEGAAVAVQVTGIMSGNDVICDIFVSNGNYSTTAVLGFSIIGSIQPTSLGNIKAAYR